MITGRRPPTVFEEKGFKTDGADNIILGGSTALSFGDKKGSFSKEIKFQTCIKWREPLQLFLEGTKKLKLLQKWWKLLQNFFCP